MVDEFLRVADVAQLLPLNEETVRNWIDRGELAAVRVGQRRVRVRRSDLDAFVAAATPEVPADATAANAHLREELAETVTRTRAHLDGGDDAELAEALRAVARAARRLARALECGE